MAQISTRQALLIFACISAVLFVHLGTPKLWDRDEPRNARASHEMLDRADWIVPTFNGELRTHKPVLLYWGQMLGYKTIGESEWTARLPSALSGLAAVFAVAVLATRLSGVRSGISKEGYYAAGALGTSLLFVMAGRAATPDGCLIAFSTLGITALVLASVRPAEPYSIGRVGKARWLPACWGYLMLGLAALAKGPVGIILPLGVVGLWWLVCYRQQQLADRNIQPDDAPSAMQSLFSFFGEALATIHPVSFFKAVWQLRIIPGLCLSILAAAPWYVAVGLETNGDFLRGFFIEHNVGRAMQSMEGHNGNLLFYPIAFLVGTFPWSLWLIPIVLWSKQTLKQRGLSRQLVVLSAAWVAIYLVAFSLASTKLPSYITPCYAGAALAIGSYLKKFESLIQFPRFAWRCAANALAITVGIAITTAVIMIGKQESIPLTKVAMFAGGSLIIAGITSLVWEFRRSIHLVPATWLTGAVAFQIAFFGFGPVTVDRYREDLALLNKLQEVSGETRWATIGGMEPSWVNYLDTEIIEIRSHPSSDESRQRIEQFFAKFPDGRLIVIGDDAHQLLGEQIGGSNASIATRTVGRCKRFLRPGQLSVVELDRGTSLASEPAVPRY